MVSKNVFMTKNGCWGKEKRILSLWAIGERICE